MPVDVAGAFQKFFEALAADDDLGNEADGGPHRIAAPDPIPHREPMIGSDAELVHGLRIGRHGHEVIAGGLLSERADDPGARRIGVGLRLLRDEGLGAHDDQGLRRIERARQILELRAIDVGHEVRRDIAAPLRAQRIAYQQGPQVRAADADIHHVPEFLAGDAELLAAAHRGDIVLEFLARGLDLGLDGRRPGKIRAQRRVQHRALLRAVDRIAAEHGGNAIGQIHRARQIQQQRQALVRNALPRDIEQPGIVLDVKMLPTLGVRTGEIAQMHLGHVFGVRRHGGPGRQRGVQFAHDGCYS